MTTAGPGGPAERTGGEVERAGGEVERAGGEYRIEDLAGQSGATVRTIRAYQDRGLLPRPGRRGRVNVYDDSHLTRLKQIAALLERGYTLASIKELLEAWDEGRGLSGVLGLVSEVEGPWTDEEPERVTRAELDELFDELFDGGAGDSDVAVAEAVELGVLVPLPDRPGEYLLPSPQELAVAAELHRAGVPLLALTEHLRELRTQVEHIAARFMELTDEHIFRRCLHTRPSDEDASEAAGLVRRLRPLAKQTVDAELARAMRTFASRSLREHLRRAAEPGPGLGGPPPGRREPGLSGASRGGPPPGRAEPGPGGTLPGGPEPELSGTLPGAPEPELSGTLPGEPEPGAPEPGLSGTLPGEPEPGAPEPGPGGASPGGPEPGVSGALPGEPEPVRLPAATLAAVRELVGAEQAAAFIAAAAEREVRARVMDGLAADGNSRPGPVPPSP